MIQYLSRCVFLFSMFSISAYADWYGGMNFGANFISIGKNLIYPYNTGAIETNAYYESSIIGFRWQLLGGYEFKLSLPATLALEANLNYNTGDASYTINNYQGTDGAMAVEQINYGYSFFILPKYHPAANVALFIGPGFSSTQFEAESRLTTGDNIGISGNIKHWLTGWGLKLGGTVAMTSCIDLYMTYEYANFGSVSAVRSEALTGTPLKATYQPVNNTVMLGFVFHTL